MDPGVKRGKLCGINVLVCGAGVGGLMTALECWRQGMEVRIIERTPHDVRTGYSFSIGPSALSTFKYWPEMERQREKIAYSPMIQLCNLEGAPMADPIEMTSVVNKAVSKETLARMRRYTRPNFHDMLLEQAAKLDLFVEYGKEVVDYFEDEERSIAGAVLKDGSKLHADVVVAADGVRTKSWSLIAGQPVLAKSSGRAMFRDAYSIETAMEDPAVMERFTLYEGRPIVEMWNGPDISAVFARSEDSIAWSIDHIDIGTAEETWTPHVDVEEVLKFTATIPGWPKVADRVIRLTPGGKLVDWKLMWRNPQPRWTSPSGRVIQLGDAAHTYLPSSGNGATQAMEDAISLAACLAVGGSGNVPNATRVHNLLRFERVSYLQALGVANRQARTKNSSQGKGKILHTEFGGWILDHKPLEYVHNNYEQALSHILNGTPFKSTNTPKGVEYKPWTIDSLVEAIEKGEPSILDGDWS